MDNKHILVTGGCGFIGSNFIRHMLRFLGSADHEPGQAHLRGQPGEPEGPGRPSPVYLCKRRHRRRRGRREGLCGADRPGNQFRRRVPRGQEHHRPGRLCENQHLRHVPPAGTGAPPGMREICPGLDRRGLRQPGADGKVHGGYAPFPQQPLFGVEGLGRHARHGLPQDLRPSGGHHALLEQLRPLPVPGKADTASYQQRPGGQDRCPFTATG